jgi:hypothetical protein
MEFVREDLEVLIPEEGKKRVKELDNIQYYIEAMKVLGFEAPMEKIQEYIELKKKENEEKILKSFEEHRTCVLESKKEFIESMMEKVVLPFKPFIHLSVCCYSSEVILVLDEEKYREAASKGEVPSLPIEREALHYLEERKKTTCCGSKCYKHPRLFE